MNILKAIKQVITQVQEKQKINILLHLRQLMYQQDKLVLGTERQTDMQMDFLFTICGIAVLAVIILRNGKMNQHGTSVLYVEQK